jgi:hypothetical protein
MRQFSTIVAKIKNSEGEFESIPALRGMSSYEVAREAGFTGTEEDWLEGMFDDGWIAKYYELDEKKANKSDVYTKEETLSDVGRNAFNLNADATPADMFEAIGNFAIDVPSNLGWWSIGDGSNVSQINAINSEFSVQLEPYDTRISGYGPTYTDGYLDIPMINKGQLYLYFFVERSDNAMAIIEEISVYNGDALLYSGEMGANTVLLDVQKGDVIRIYLRGYSNSSDYISHAYVKHISLFANMDTVYKYATLNVGTSVTTTADIGFEVLSALLGV